MQAYDVFLWKSDKVKSISDEESGSGDKGGEKKGRWDLEVMDTSKLVLHPDLLANRVSHQTGFIDSDCKLRTCVELCYNISLPHSNIIPCILSYTDCNL